MKGDKWLWAGAAILAVFALLPKPAAATPTPVVNGLPLISGQQYGLNTAGGAIVPPLYGGSVFNGITLGVTAPTGGITNPPAVAADTTGGSFQSYQQPIIPLSTGTDLSL